MFPLYIWTWFYNNRNTSREREPVIYVVHYEWKKTLMRMIYFVCSSIFRKGIESCLLVWLLVVVASKFWCFASIYHFQAGWVSRFKNLKCSSWIMIYLYMLGHIIWFFCLISESTPVWESIKAWLYWVSITTSLTSNKTR